jgi:hypothetical protein
MGIDAQTLQTRVICVTSNEATDAAVVADLLDQVPCHESIWSLAGNGAHTPALGSVRVFAFGQEPRTTWALCLRGDGRLGPFGGKSFTSAPPRIFPVSACAVKR